jgi:hypothetical protein
LTTRADPREHASGLSPRARNLSAGLSL